jgi:hypothetical protein
VPVPSEATVGFVDDVVVVVVVGRVVVVVDDVVVVDVVVGRVVVVVDDVVVVVGLVVVVVVVLVVVVVGDVVVVVVPPPAGTPFTVKEAGTGLLAVQLPWKPNDVVPPVASVPLYATFDALTVAPLWLTVAFQALVTLCPLSGKTQPSVQPVTASPVFRTSTLATNPPPHWAVTV